MKKEKQQNQWNKSWLFDKINNINKSSYTDQEKERRLKLLISEMKEGSLLPSLKKERIIK